jgi:protein dithiol oxidoreductase (disulfide-forming)
MKTTSMNPSSNKFFRALTRMAAVGTALFTSAALHAQPAGDVIRIDPPQPVEADGKIEVLEFFSYGCSHCNKMEPDIEKWAKTLPKDVRFRRVPAGEGFEFRGIKSVPLFYTLEAMGKLDGLHAKILMAANVENVALGSPPVLKQWLTKNGVDAEKFDTMQRSFSVQSKVSSAMRMTQNYKLPSTPYFVVDGRVGVRPVDTPEQTFFVIGREIAAARARRLGVGPKG